MSILKQWNDLITLKNGDKISYKDVSYTITGKSYDQDQGGADYTFTIVDDNNKKKVLRINIFGQISGDFPSSSLDQNELKKISSGGKRKRKTKRRLKRRAKKTRRYYK